MNAKTVDTYYADAPGVPREKLVKLTDYEALVLKLHQRDEQLASVTESFDEATKELIAARSRLHDAELVAKAAAEKAGESLGQLLEWRDKYILAERRLHSALEAVSVAIIGLRYVHPEKDNEAKQLAESIEMLETVDLAPVVETSLPFAGLPEHHHGFAGLPDKHQPK